MFGKTAIGRVRRILEHTVRLMKKLCRKQKRYQYGEEETSIGYETFPPKHRPDQ
jgi:hypothetical protein